MAEIVNLRLVRKAKKRAADTAQAETNRALYGATKAERRITRDEAERLTRNLDGAKRTTD